MFNRKSENQAPARRLVLCASSSDHVLSDALKRIDFEVAEALSVKSTEELRSVLCEYEAEGESEEENLIDDLILFTDLTGELELVSLVKEVPISINIFLVRNAPINGLLLRKIDEEGVEYLEPQEIGELYSREVVVTEVEEPEPVKKSFIEKMPKLPKLGMNFKSREKLAENTVVADEEIKPSEDELVIKPKKLPLMNRKIAEPQVKSDRVIRRIKVTDHQVVVKKQVSTKIKRTEERRLRIAVTGMQGAGKTTHALALSWILSESGKSTGLIDLDWYSERNLSDVCGAPEDEDGLGRLFSGHQDPFQLDKKARLQLYTSRHRSAYSSNDIASIAASASAFHEALVMDVPVSLISPVQGYDRIIFVIDGDPFYLRDQLDALKETGSCKMAKLTIVFNKHTKSCLSRRELRKDVKEALEHYVNDIHVCSFSADDVDYMRRMHRGAIDGSGFVSARKTAREIARQIV